MLRRHPQLYMPELKEPLFFASDLRPFVQQRDPERPPIFPATYEEYLSIFTAARDDQRVGEASSSYLRSRVAAQAIAQAQPDARIIAIVREPASLVRSLHLQRLQEHIETEPDLARALVLEEIRREGVRARPRDRPQMLLYSDFTCYVEQLRRYHDVFAAEQVKTLVYDDFRLDNEKTVRELLRFLEVDDSVPIIARQANATVAVRSARLERIVRRAQTRQGPLSGPAHALITTLVPTTLRARARRRVMYRSPPPADATVMNELRRRFKPEVEALSEYLKRDLLTLWGYESLG